jgi:hypothetical protein
MVEFSPESLEMPPQLYSDSPQDEQHSNFLDMPGDMDMTMQELYNDVLETPNTGLPTPREMLIAKNPLEDKQTRFGRKNGDSEGMEFVAWGDYVFEPTVRAIFLEAGPGYVYEMFAKEIKVYEVSCTNCPSSRCLVTPPEYTGRKPLAEDVQTEVYLEDSTGRYGPYGTYTFEGVDNRKKKNLLEFLRNEFVGQVELPAAKQEMLQLLLDQAQALIDAQENSTQPSEEAARTHGKREAGATKRGQLIRFEAEPGVKRRRIEFGGAIDGAASASSAGSASSAPAREKAPLVHI